MKKYKLIKKYLVSPALGTIKYISNHPLSNGHIEIDGRLINPNDYSEYWEEIIEYPIGTKVYNSKTDTIYTKKEDGWYKPMEKTAFTDKVINKRHYLTLLDENDSKIVEKNYEILSFIEEGSDILFQQLNNVKSGDENPAYSCNRKDIITYCQCLNDKCLKIHSVKRLSDEKVFQLGNHITSNYNAKNEDRNVPHPITTMEVNDYGHLLLYTDIFKAGLKINKAVKCKKLFTTNDGVDIFEGDNLHWVCDEFTYFYTKDVSKIYCNLINSAKTEDFKIFPTKETAEEYILMNKPCLSINDILNITYNPVETRYSTTNKLKELVKSKL